MHSTYIVPRTGSIKLKLPLRTLSGRARATCSCEIDAYHAPETFRGVRSTANDIWSMGIILLELVTSTSAYEECANSQELLLALLEHRLPQAIEAVTPPNVAEFIALCLVEEPLRPKIEELLGNPLLAEGQGEPQGFSAPASPGSPAFDLLRT
jgi:serine/threonine protein kinase